MEKIKNVPIPNMSDYQLYGFELYVDNIFGTKINNLKLNLKLFDHPWMNMKAQNLRNPSMVVLFGSWRTVQDSLGDSIEASASSEQPFTNEISNPEEVPEENIDKAEENPTPIQNQETLISVATVDTQDNVKCHEDPENEILRGSRHLNTQMGNEFKMNPKCSTFETQALFTSEKCCVFSMSPIEMLHRLQRQPLIVNINNGDNKISTGYLSLYKFSRAILRATLGPPYPLMSTITGHVKALGDFNCHVQMTVRILCFGIKNRMQVTLPGENPNAFLTNGNREKDEEEDEDMPHLEHFIADRKFPEAIVTGPENLMRDKKKEYVAPRIEPKKKFEMEDINFCPIHRVIGHPKEKLTHDELITKAEILLGAKFDKTPIKLHIQSEDEDEEEAREKKETEAEKESEKRLTESTFEETDIEKEEEKELTQEMMMDYLNKNKGSRRAIRRVVKILNQNGTLEEELDTEIAALKSKINPQETDVSMEFLPAELESKEVVE